MSSSQLELHRKILSQKKEKKAGKEKKPVGA